MWLRNCTNADQTHQGSDSDLRAGGDLFVPRIQQERRLPRRPSAPAASDRERCAVIHQRPMPSAAHTSVMECPSRRRPRPAALNNRLPYPPPSCRPATAGIQWSTPALWRPGDGRCQRELRHVLRKDSEPQQISQQENQGIRFWHVDNGGDFSRVLLQERLEFPKPWSPTRAGKYAAVDNDDSFPPIARVGVDLGNEARRYRGAAVCLHATTLSSLEVSVKISTVSGAAAQASEQLGKPYRKPYRVPRGQVLPWLRAEGCGVEAGSWKLETGSWRLDDGRCEAGTPQRVGFGK